MNFLVKDQRGKYKSTANRDKNDNESQDGKHLATKKRRQILTIKSATRTVSNQSSSQEEKQSKKVKPASSAYKPVHANQPKDTKLRREGDNGVLCDICNAMFFRIQC